MTTLEFDVPVQGQPGDEFIFQARGNTQYRVTVTGGPMPLPQFSIGMYVSNIGFRANKQGQAYCDGTPPKGPVTVKVFNHTSPFIVSVKARSWWEKVFGW